MPVSPAPTRTVVLWAGAVKERVPMRTSTLATVAVDSVLATCASTATTACDAWPGLVRLTRGLLACTPHSGTCTGSTMRRCVCL